MPGVGVRRGTAPPMVPVRTVWVGVEWTNSLHTVA